MGGPPPTTRRDDIQGLRAIAVLMVVAYHAGLPIPGGFVGVDVFFVISGFVITAMLRRESAATGGVRLGAFYARRFQRLGPALALMVSTVVLASVFLLSPLGPQQTVARTAIGAMLLSANVVIARSTGTYFDPPAATNPLLHTWSLSVEEQFYLVFPLALAAAWSFGRGKGRAWLPIVVVGAGGLVSFGLTVLGTFTGPSPEIVGLNGFYAAPVRAWEFAVGALVALSTMRLRRAEPYLGAIGLVMLAAAPWCITSATPSPGTWTLLPVVGTALVMVGATDERSVIARVVGAPLLVATGDVSYAIYLWHWPLIVFATTLWPDAPRAPWVAALLSAAPAIASYAWVERPVREARGLTGARLARLVGIVLGPTLALATTLLVVSQVYWLPQVDGRDVAAVHAGDIGQLAYHSYVSQHFAPCTPPQMRDHAMRWEGMLRCPQSKGDAAVTIAVLGDSHAEDLFVGLAEALPEQNVVAYIAGGIPVRTNPDFAPILDQVVSSTSIRTVIVNAHWSDHGVPVYGIADTLAALTTSGKTVFVLDDRPDFPFDAFRCKHVTSWLVPAECSMNSRRFWDRFAQFEPALESAVALVPGARLRHIAHYFCDDASCDMTHDGVLLFRDTDHFNVDGSRWVIERLLADDAQFRAVLTGHASP